MSYADRMLTCRGCGNSFPFTAGEQEFYAQKGFTNDPARCPACRQARKQANGELGGEGAMARSVGAGPRQRVQHEVVCAGCGQTTRVPFVPNGSKPVYCYDCYQGQHRSSVV